MLYFEHENDKVRIKEETLAYQLWMDGLVKNRKWQEIRKVIKRSLEVAKAIEFITDFTYDEGMIDFTIDYDTLYRVENKFKKK